MKRERQQNRDVLRREGYRNIGLEEQVGALVKAVEALANGDPIPPDASEVFERIRSVKQRFPKKNPA